MANIKWQYYNTIEVSDPPTAPRLGEDSTGPSPKPSRDGVALCVFRDLEWDRIRVRKRARKRRFC
jgi:hypothetical protein